MYVCTIYLVKVDKKISVVEYNCRHSCIVYHVPSSVACFIIISLFSHYSCHLLSCNLLACAYVVADKIAWNKNWQLLCDINKLLYPGDIFRGIPGDTPRGMCYDMFYFDWRWHWYSENSFVLRLWRVPTRIRIIKK